MVKKMNFSMEIQNSSFKGAILNLYFFLVFWCKGCANATSYTPFSTLRKIEKKFFFQFLFYFRDKRLQRLSDFGAL